ncbi:DNA topoisomerase IV, alpha subunit [Aureobasidium sp. EXF-10728]|nr:DNA topoisomerase IV, alpha subunit [Aureobasidium sp. EXF-10728]
MEVETDVEMLFGDGGELSTSQGASRSDGPQLCRPDKHHNAITQIEAVFETAADALLNERADITISLTSKNSNELRDASVRAPKATAGVKGLMAGAAVIYRRDGSKIDLTNVQSGILVPSMEEVLSVDLTRVRWVLVIEKEATFQSVLSSEDWQEMMWHAVLVTGKGYPDIATRAVTRFMTVASPRNGFAEPPLFGLVDFDPDGLAILHTYKHGSEKMSQENAELVVPRIRWLGLHSSTITDEDQTHRNQGLLTLTPRDRHKAKKMLEWEQHSFVEAAHWRRELQVMLMLNLKAELQILDSDPSGLMNIIKMAAHDTSSI